MLRLRLVSHSRSKRAEDDSATCYLAVCVLQQWNPYLGAHSEDPGRGWILCQEGHSRQLRNRITPSITERLSANYGKGLSAFSKHSPSIRVFSNESALRIRWPKCWSFSFNISPSNEQSLSLTSSSKCYCFKISIPNSQRNCSGDCALLLTLPHCL